MLSKHRHEAMPGMWKIVGDTIHDNMYKEDGTRFVLNIVEKEGTIPLEAKTRIYIGARYGRKMVGLPRV